MMAARSGDTENAMLTEAEQEIDYILGSDGKMYPDTSIQFRASDGLAFADSIEPPEPAGLEHELDNLVVSGTVYRDPDGTMMLRVVLTNDTVDYDSIRLKCEVYLDDSETPYYLDLPYYPEYMSSGCAQTIDLPLSLLANGTDAQKARVVIQGIGIEEAVLTVPKALPLTGDNIDQTLMIFLIGIILLAVWFRISPRRKEENPSSKG